MSTPTSVTLPDGVDAVTVHTARGAFAAHRSCPPDPVAQIVLVPGWTGSKEDFTPVLPLLSAAGFGVTAYDQRGQFESPGGPGDDYTLAALAADALAVAGDLGGRPHLLGHSFGGLVAQRAVVDHPGAWASVSLLCSGPGALGEEAARFFAPLIRSLTTVPLDTIHTLREQIAGVDRPPEIAEFLRRRFTSNSADGLRAFTQHLVDAPDCTAEVAATGVPVWVGRGAGDDAWPHPVQDAMASRLGTTVRVIDGADHSPAVENPRGLVDAWLPFLRSR
ncbi:hydrolase, alpha/beta domain protein [Aeromicrobium marinum DSM 15272]|uniref:Hydrolase, alpha/beta domain protein n=1 Tax=Aeromicrobium marinum DSM 15272 TaxID=585531 RepID=E2SE95_9ACTN|nr:alpha/beta hydrolase [Aeromicrobium marinum]EFQ82822.1 hydrolase, alpha/beta domain protein [Aeromicrobium marinum DSM 15272]